jgi:hypothetical protein
MMGVRWLEVFFAAGAGTARTSTRPIDTTIVGGAAREAVSRGRGNGATKIRGRSGES